MIVVILYLYSPWTIVIRTPFPGSAKFIPSLNLHQASLKFDVHCILQNSQNAFFP